MSRSRTTRRLVSLAVLAAVAGTLPARAQTAPAPVQAASTVAPVDPGTTVPPTPATPSSTAAAVTTAAPVATTAPAAAATTSVALKSAAATTTVAAATGGKAGRSKAGLYLPNGRPSGPPVGWRWGLTSPDPALPAATTLEAATNTVAPGGRLFTALIIGSDARPGEKFTRTRGDSIHLFVFNPKLGKGTIIGFPRDTYVNVPGRGMSKITAALSFGGPSLMVTTVSQVTGITIPLYVVTGFDGFTKIVNAVGGVNVLVSPKMNEPLSGATFEQGWFSMNGDAALAFTRNRHGVANGDFTRSANQAKFLLYALSTMRERAADPTALLTWVNAVRKNADTNIKPADMLVLAQMIRHIDPDNIATVVVKGKPAMVKGSSVVQMDAAAAKALFDDVRADGVIGVK